MQREGMSLDTDDNLGLGHVGNASTGGSQTSGRGGGVQAQLGPTQTVVKRMRVYGLSRGTCSLRRATWVRSLENPKHSRR